jgi:pimeloyl-ACP methyl ester carboxylesterase
METGTVPIVLLHGVGLDSSMWALVSERMGRPTIAVDLPGHGSRRAFGVPTGLAAFADDVLARLPETPVHLVGFSLGALVAQHIARYSPARLRSLTCVSTVADRTPDERSAVLARLADARRDFPATIERSLLRWYPAESGVDPDQIVETRRVLELNDVPSFTAAYEIFAVGDAELAPQLGRIDVPTLAITGELDPGSTPAMTERLTAAVPGSRGVIVPGVRHMLPIEAPATLVAELRSFLDHVEGQSHD